MSSPVPNSDAPGGAPQTLTASQSFVFSDTQFKTLVAELKGGSPVGAIVGSVEAVNADIVARLKAVLADAEGARTHVHGAAKALQADVKANWPLLLVGAFAIAGFVLHFVKVFGFGG